LWGQAAALQGEEISERTTLESLGPFLEVPKHLTLGRIRRTETGSECDAERRSHRDARRDLVDLALRRTPMGDSQERKRVLISGFPHLVKEYIPSHLILVIPTAGGEASVAAA